MSKKRIVKRTGKGTVTAAARKRHGIKSGAQKGAFPIFDRKSATSAIRLRGRAKTSAIRESILRRAARYVPAQAKKARAADRKTGKI